MNSGAWEVGSDQDTVAIFGGDVLWDGQLRTINIYKNDYIKGGWDMENTFNGLIKSQRIAKRITLRAFSEQLGIAPSNYGRLVRGLSHFNSHLKKCSNLHSGRLLATV